LLRRGFIATADDNAFCAALGKKASNGRAKTLCAAGDNGDFTCKLSH